MQRRFFDPQVFRILLFDQRGAGRSTPCGETARNTTADLVDDMERLRIELAIDAWILFGGSWGSTLALAYAQRYPQRCLGLILRGVFLGQLHEIDWLMYGLAALSPAAWDDFASVIHEVERCDILSAYQKRLNDPNPLIHELAAWQWCRYEAVNSTLRNDNESMRTFMDRHLLGLARIEAHYYAHDCFLRERQLLEDAETLVNLPCIIVQGKYDLLSPMQTAYRLHQALPSSRLVIVEDAGHSAFEISTARALVKATNDMRSAIKPKTPLEKFFYA